MDQMSNYVKAAAKFVKKQLKASGVTLADLDDSGVLAKAGGGLDLRWMQRLTAGEVARISARQVIALRRLFAVPVDTIIGLSYMTPDYADEQAGIVRIARRMGTTYKKGLWRKLGENGGSSPEIVSRIIKFSTWAVVEHAGNINTPADEVRKQLIQTFSLSVLVRFKWALHTNIDDILGLGEYSPEAEYLASRDSGRKAEEEEAKEWTEDDQKKLDAENAARAAFLVRNQKARAELNAHRKNNALTIAHFQPAASREEANG